MQKPVGLWGAYVMGLAFAFGWTPCIGPILAAILAVAASEATVTKGAGLLAVYSLGLGVPFMLAALAVEPFAAFLARFRAHLAHVERVMGGLLVLTGIAFLVGFFTQLNNWLLEAFPALGGVIGILARVRGGRQAARSCGEGKVASFAPAALIVWFGSLGLSLARIGLEAGPLSQWLYAAMQEAGLAVELLETRHVRNAFKAMPVKSDRNDARGIAQLMRLGWFRPVHCKSLGAQEVRALLTARKLVQSKLLDVENSLRGILRGFGLKVGKTTQRSFAGRVEELVAGASRAGTIAQALLGSAPCCCASSTACSRSACGAWRARMGRRELLMTTPAVGPDRGAHLRLPPSTIRRASNRRSRRGRISG